ncbi:hypothetical protein LCGC14_0513890 [marine sediment metagenome]|uniref:Uncharacterized protein n=1 Tax=marine sediment metagenome TaxID=412755 RepID=A0A0F9SIW9_9ZZZZ
MDGASLTWLHQHVVAHPVTAAVLPPVTEWVQLPAPRLEEPHRFPVRLLAAAGVIMLPSPVVADRCRRSCTFSQVRNTQNRRVGCSLGGVVAAK